MWNDTADKRLSEFIPGDRILRDEPMYKHTTFKVGGPAKRYISVDSSDELVGILKAVKDSDSDFFVIGHGSNILVSDSGFDGLVVELCHMSGDVKVEGLSLTTEAGTMLSRLSAAARDNSLTGLEFASGIPGTVGGAIYMNAGAYGGEIADVLRLATVFDPATGEIFDIVSKDMDFSYRHSIIKDRGYVVLSAVFDLKEGDSSVIESRMKEFNERRRAKQPLEYPSAGSTFKRPEGFFAGGLIEECGLKGYSVGDAQVSEKHAGFVINKGHATATDIYRLIREIREKVYADTGVIMEPEVGLLGDFV